MNSHLAVSEIFCTEVELGMDEVPVLKIVVRFWLDLLLQRLEPSQNKDDLGMYCNSI